MDEKGSSSVVENKLQYLDVSICKESTRVSGPSDT
jgi:hypothetical protein